MKSKGLVNKGTIGELADIWLLTSKQTAAVMGVEEQTLRVYRWRGRSLPAVRLGRAIFYSIVDIEARTDPILLGYLGAYDPRSESKAAYIERWSILRHALRT